MIVMQTGLLLYREKHITSWFVGIIISAEALRASLRLWYSPVSDQDSKLGASDETSNKEWIEEDAAVVATTSSY